ncbi:MAG: EAL domain-containing protein [Microcystaceae cyanobacterium]
MSSAKILIIEDEVAIRELIMEMLELYDFQTVGAANGKEGLNKVSQERPDLILCDVMMPKLDGYGVLTELQRCSQTRHIPFIFLTAKVSKENIRQGMNLGADDYVTKPFTQEDLVQAIQARLAKKNCLNQDISSKIKKVNHKASYYLYHHPVTRLPNQFLLRQLFEQAITKRHANTDHTSTDQLLPIAYLKLDRFSQICETLTYTESDQLLKAVTQRLQDILGDNRAITHLNTDEFIILMEGIKYQQQADLQAEEILNQLTYPFSINEQEIFVSASMGMAFYPSHSRRLESLIAKSKSAVQRFNKLGGNQYQRYLPSFDLAQQNQQKRLDLESRLHHAIERDELDLYYQPRVDLTTGRVTGAEALLRWHPSDLDFISPSEFVPIAEETGLIQSIGQWALKTACQQSVQLHNIDPELKIAVNLSARQFYSLKPYEEMLRIVQDVGVQTHCLELELTEGILGENPAIARTKLNAFKTLGIKIALDDFGTGYSSLQYIQDLPIDILKIDHRFIHQVDRNPKNAVIVKTLISLACQLNLDVIAEGIETEGELKFLQKNHCQEAQGFLLSRPMPFHKLEEKIQLSQIGLTYPTLLERPLPNLQLVG